jgi:hypothetical protein
MVYHEGPDTALSDADLKRAYQIEQTPLIPLVPP